MSWIRLMEKIMELVRPVQLQIEQTRLCTRFGQMANPVLTDRIKQPQPPKRLNCRGPRAYSERIAFRFGAEKGSTHERPRNRMNDHSKFIGYFALAILVMVFVAWAKYGLVSDSVFWATLIATCAFFVGWRTFTGTWPGNDARR
jgi:hypothetical protein